MGDTNSNGFTNKEILIRLEEKVDKVLDDHEKRIRILEKFKYALPPTAFTAIAGVVAAFIR